MERQKASELPIDAVQAQRDQQVAGQYLQYEISRANGDPSKPLAKQSPAVIAKVREQVVAGIKNGKYSVGIGRAIMGVASREATYEQGLRRKMQDPGLLSRRRETAGEDVSGILRVLFPNLTGAAPTPTPSAGPPAKPHEYFRDAYGRTRMIP